MPHSGAPHPTAPSVPSAAVRNWQRVRETWLMLENVQQSERLAALERLDVDAAVRGEVRRLLMAADTVGTRFDVPALVALSTDDPWPLPDASSAPRAGTSLIGHRIGPFRVLRRIGEGGMGAVYEAVRDDAAYDQRVAIKSLWREAHGDVLLQRFQTERQLLARLRHPHIAQLLDGGTTDTGVPWLALEFVDGEPIDQYCDRKQLPLAARLDLFRDVCAAVQFAHRLRIVHRDLKPSNIFVDADGVVKLLDFGIAKLLDPGAGDSTLTRAGLAPYTPAYAAPEQVTGAEIAETADVYALGMVLVRLLSGGAALDVRDAFGEELTRRITMEPATAPSVLVRGLAQADGLAIAKARGFASADRLAQALEGELDAIALMALRKEPARRYPSVDALSDDVRRHLRRDRVLARPDSLMYRLSATARRRPGLASGLAVAVAACGLVLITQGQQYAAARRETERTERVARFMAGLVAGPDLAAGDPLLAVGPRGTVSQLLDEAIVRVPVEFARDPRSRAHLYTAIGTNLVAQERFDAAAHLLDSAVILSRASYGEDAEPVARAELELARVRFFQRGPAAARMLLLNAQRSVLRHGGTPALREGSALLEARIRRAEGDVRGADSLARRVLEGLNVPGSPTVLPSGMSRVRALLLLAITEAWLERDPRAYVRRCRHAGALADSLGARRSSESLEAALCQATGLLTLGRLDAADSLLRDTQLWYEAAYGAQTTGMAALRVHQASVAVARGNVLLQRQLVQQAQDILDSVETVAAEQAVAVASTLVELQRAEGNVERAQHLALWARAHAVAQQVPVAIIVAELTVAKVAMARGDLDLASSAMARGLAAFPSTGDLDSMRPALLRTAVAISEAQGSRLRADSLRAMLPAPSNPAPDCTPGGRWSGCPDR